MNTVLSPGAIEHPLLERLCVSFDPDARMLVRGGRNCHLAPRESGVLAVLLQSAPDQVISRNDFINAVWGDGEICEDALTVIISRLRRHFVRLGIAEPVIETVPRRGYRLCRCDRFNGGVNEARRAGRSARTFGLAALVMSALALVTSLAALWAAMD